MNGKHNDVCENRLTERWLDEDYTDEYWDGEICPGIYV
jgi:hypothetical protein